MHVDGLALDTWVHTKFHNYMACELWPIVGLLQHKKKQRERERERDVIKWFCVIKRFYDVNLYKNTYFLFIQRENIIAGIFEAKTSIFRAKEF